MFMLMSVYAKGEQLKKRKEHLTTVLNYITTGKVLNLVDEMVSHRHMWIRRREIIMAINALKLIKTTWIDGAVTELFIAASASFTRTEILGIRDASQKLEEIDDPYYS